MSKLLTVDQAAAYLGISPHTLAGWRAERRGPAYAVMAAESNDNGRPGKRAIRYPIDELEKFVETRIENPTTKDASPRKIPTSYRLTDADWSLIVTALKPRVDGGHAQGMINAGHKQRAFLDRLLAACDAERWPDMSMSERHLTGRILRDGTEPGGWILKAFDALADSETFPYSLGVTFTARRKGANGGQYDQALVLRTELHGPRMRHRSTNGWAEKATNSAHRSYRNRREERETAAVARNATTDCAVCGKPFPAVSKAKRFCSAACRREWHHAREKGREMRPGGKLTAVNCAWCGTEFRPVSPRNVYCCAKHRVLAKIDRLGSSGFVENIRAERAAKKNLTEP